MTDSKLFARSSFGINGIAQRSLGVPAAAYPGRIATNSDLIVAVDRQQTRLALPMGTTDTSMTVLDPSMIVAYNLLSIDNEIVKTTGPPTGNVVPISRGFDGTVAAVHLVGATVSGFIDAYHHNGLVAEIEAIEAALGPNLSRIPASPFVIAGNYNFPAQTPGGSLVAGANVIPLAPVPAGVNGSDVDHWLYISGGTGTAEAGLIIGGSAVAGSPSGTVIVQCANTHSGAWTIQSASSGIREAIIAAPNGTAVLITQLISSAYAPIVIDRTITVMGMGIGETVVQASGDYGDIFRFTGNSLSTGGRLSGVGISSVAARTSGAGVRVTGRSTSAGWYGVILDNLLLASNLYDGIKLEMGYYTRITEILATGTAHAALYFRGTSGTQPVGDLYLSNITVSSGARSLGSVVIGSYAEGIYGTSITLEGSDLTGSAHFYTLDDAASGASFPKNLFFDKLVCDSSGTRGVMITNTFSAYFTNFWCASSAQEGVLLGPGAQDILISNGRVIANAKEGIKLTTTTTWDVSILGSMIDTNSASAPGTYSGIWVDAGISDFHIQNCRFLRKLSSSNHKYSIEVTAGASDRYHITDNDLRGAVTGPLSDGGSGAVKQILGNIAIDDNVPTVASAATITLPANPMIRISGTVPIVTMNGGWDGRLVRLSFIDPAPGGVTTGGSFYRAQTAVQYQTITFTGAPSNTWY